MSMAKKTNTKSVETKEQDKPQINPALEKIKGKKLMIATPCYGGLVNEGYAQSMFTLPSICTQFGVSVGYITIANESLVTRARNELVNAFMKSDADYLMFIDADIRFDPKAIIRMLTHDKDVVVGAYPLKQLDWEKVVSAAKEKTLSPKEAVKEAAMYVINVHKPDADLVGKTVDVQIKNGLLEVYDAGTGFMLIKRSVIEKMIEKYPETKYYSDRDVTLSAEENTRYALFDTEIDADRRYLSEDYTFCRRWQKLDGKIHLDVNTVLDHVGTHIFRGSSIVRPK
jgi:glycosyltransferase involved in cell wall biosynthesis